MKKPGGRPGSMERHAIGGQYSDRAPAHAPCAMNGTIGWQASPSRVMRPFDQLGITDGKAVGGRVEALDAALDRMTDRLATVGGRLQDVVKLTYFVTDLTLRDEANRQFERTFAEPRPARTFLEVSKLPYGATVEIDCIAHLKPELPG